MINFLNSNYIIKIREIMSTFTTVDNTQDEVKNASVIDDTPYKTLITPAPDNSVYSDSSCGTVGTVGTRVSGCA